MSEIKLTEKNNGYTLVKRNCPNSTCNAEFIFRFDGEKIHDIVGNTVNNSENTIQCKVCDAKYQFEVFKKTRTPYNKDTAMVF